MSSSAITAPLYLDPTKAADGSAASPSFAFANSTSTGIYRVSANTLGISTAGVQAGQVSSTGAWTLGPSGFTGTHTLRGGIATGEIVVGSTSATSGTYNNYSTANIGLVMGVTGSTTFTGFSNATTGKVLYVAVSNAAVTLTHNDSASSAGNRIFTITGANVTRTTGGFTLIYDGNNGRWVQTG